MDHAAEAQRTDLMTITRHVLNEQGRHPESRGDFTILLSHIVLGCKFVASAVNKAGLAKLIGLAGDTNVQASNPISDPLYSTLLFLHTNPCDGGWPPRVSSCLLQFHAVTRTRWRCRVRSRRSLTCSPTKSSSRRSSAAAAR